MLRDVCADALVGLCARRTARPGRRRGVGKSAAEGEEEDTLEADVVCGVGVRRDVQG